MSASIKAKSGKVSKGSDKVAEHSNEHNEMLNLPLDLTGIVLLKERIKDVLEDLTERERRILEQRFGLVDGYSRTLEELERQFRITRERVRRLEKRVLSKMRHLGPAEIIEHINKGLPFRELEHVRSQIDEPLESLARQLSISRSTLQRRRAEKKLSPPESDRLMRFCQIMRHAARVFGSLERARAWLKHPQRGLGGAIPLDYASTEVGAREVENLLGRIDYGVYS
jgi:putative toxin-antitoxin system antitoxin component (TIGR02293 family)